MRVGLEIVQVGQFFEVGQEFRFYFAILLPKNIPLKFARNSFLLCGHCYRISCTFYFSEIFI